MKPFRTTASARLALLGCAAIGFALLAVYAADRHVDRAIAQQHAASRKPETPGVTVVVAKFDLIAGERVSADNMAARAIPADMAPGSAIRPEQFDVHVGARLARPVRSGEPLLAEILQAPEPAGLAHRVRQGIRAITLAVDEVSSVSGLLRPGDRIDLLFTARVPGVPGANQTEMTRVLVQDVAVLATGRQVSPGTEEAGARGYTSITMELGPEDAKRVVAAQRAGRLTAMLRNPDDRHAVSTVPVDIHTLLGLPREPARAVAPALPQVPPGPELITGGVGRIGASRERVDTPTRMLPPVADMLSADGGELRIRASASGGDASGFGGGRALAGDSISRDPVSIPAGQAMVSQGAPISSMVSTNMAPAAPNSPRPPQTPQSPVQPPLYR